MLLAQFARISKLPDGNELVTMSLLVGYFAFAIMSYMVQGYRGQTDNQFRQAGPGMACVMWSLVVADIGGLILPSANGQSIKQLLPVRN